MREKNSYHSAPSFSVMHVALMLLCAVMVSVYLTGGIAARYVAVAEGTATARVAKFDVSCQSVSETPLDINLNFLDPAQSQDTFDFTTVSNSEVTVSYDVEIQLPVAVTRWIDSGLIAVDMDGEDPVQLNVEEGIVTFAGNTFSYGENSATHTLTFTASATAMPESEESITGEKAVLRILAKQVD